MSCRLTKDIKHSCTYTPGGISEIYLLDICDFISYRFRDDRLYNQCFIDSIRISASDYIKLDVVNETNFIESQEDGIYTQSMTTFIRSLDYQKTSNLLLAASNRYLIVFRTQGKMFSFGSDGGASLNFTQQTGQRGETDGYSITISKKSIYPLFEAAPDKTEIESLLSTQDKTNLVITEDGYCIPIIESWKK